MEGGEASEREIARVLSGEVVGEIPFVSVRPIATTVKAASKSLVMSSQQQLAVKLQQDVGFASRFYRVIAILLSDRLQSIITQFGRSNLAQGQQLRDVLFVLGELHDISNRLHGRLGRLGYGRRVYSKDQPLDEAVKYDSQFPSPSH